jgi:hypothetical protein
MGVERMRLLICFDSQDLIYSLDTMNNVSESGSVALFRTLWASVQPANLFVSSSAPNGSPGVNASGTELETEFNQQPTVEHLLNNLAASQRGRRYRGHWDFPKDLT